MTTLVTGAGGFIGGQVVRRLAASGEKVRAFDLRFPAGLADGVDRIEASILDPVALEQAVSGVDYVVHAAAIAHLWTPNRFDYDRVNVVGTCRVLAAARRAGAKLVHVSSYTTLIAEDTPAGAVLDESHEVAATRLLGPYPLSKRQAEGAVLSAAATGQDATIVMPSAPVGAGDINMTPPTLMLRDLASGRIPALLSCSLNLVDVVAVADAIISAREYGTSGERYLLSGDDLPMRDVAAAVAEKTGTRAPRHSVPLMVALGAARVEALLARVTKKPPKAPLTGVRLAARPCAFDNSKARAALDFDPRPFGECLDDALAWLRDIGYVT